MKIPIANKDEMINKDKLHTFQIYKLYQQGGERLREMKLKKPILPQNFNFLITPNCLLNIIKSCFRKDPWNFET